MRRKREDGDIGDGGMAGREPDGPAPPSAKMTKKRPRRGSLKAAMGEVLIKPEPVSDDDLDEKPYCDDDDAISPGLIPVKPEVDATQSRSRPHAHIKTETRRSRIKAGVKPEPECDADADADTDSKAKIPIPSRNPRSKKTALEATPTEPDLWKTQYVLTQRMRARLPPAAVDTMGCAFLADRTAPRPIQRFQTLVSLMLSSQTKDEVTSAAIKKLQTELPGGLTPDSILSLKDTPDVLNRMIGSVGFHNMKTRYLLQTAQICVDQYGGDIPSTLAGLTGLPGVGPKMAFLTLGAEAGWDDVCGIGVDVHVHRIANRWKWCNTKDPEHTRQALEAWLPQELWRAVNPLLVGFGQLVCASKPKCGQCDLAAEGVCPASTVKAPGKSGMGDDDALKLEPPPPLTIRKTRQKGKISDNKQCGNGSSGESTPSRVITETLTSFIRTFSHSEANPEDASEEASLLIAYPDDDPNISPVPDFDIHPASASLSPCSSYSSSSSSPGLFSSSRYQDVGAKTSSPVIRSKYFSAQPSKSAQRKDKAGSIPTTTDQSNERPKTVVRRSARISRSTKTTTTAAALPSSSPDIEDLFKS